MILAAIELVTSKAKWAKLALLLRERGTMAWYTARGVVHALPASDAVGRGGVAWSDGPIRSGHQAWTYNSHLVMPEELLVGEGTRFRQDTRLADGSLQTEYSYQSAVYHEATFYSNGTSHVSLFDRCDQRVPDFSYSKYGGGVPRVRQLEVVRYLPGVTLSLYGNVENTAGNIGHWMIDGISRLFLALKHHSLEDIDQVLVPKLKYGFQRESLLALGIPDHKIVEVDVLDCVRCEQLIVTTAPRGFSSSSTPGWLIDGFREALLPAQASVKTGKRIYISRRDAGSRKFVNEEEIIACLEGLGFEAVEMSDYGFNEKIALFAQAEIIVGLTGAGLTNMLFCRPNACVVELFPASYVTYFYTSIGCYLGLDYDYIVFDNASMLSSMNRYYGNLSLDTAVLSDKLAEVLKRCEMT